VELALLGLEPLEPVSQKAAAPSDSDLLGLKKFGSRS